MNYQTIKEGQKKELAIISCSFGNQQLVELEEILLYNRHIEVKEEWN